MIGVKIEKDGSEYRVLVNGHAGYAGAGQDIVCAGMSTLAYALAEACRREKCLLDLQEEPGKMTIRIERCYQTKIMLEVFRSGAEMMAAQYPDHVAIA